MIDDNQELLDWWVRHQPDQYRRSVRACEVMSQLGMLVESWKRDEPEIWVGLHGIPRPFVGSDVWAAGNGLSKVLSFYAGAVWEPQDRATLLSSEAGCSLLLSRYKGACMMGADGKTPRPNSSASPVKTLSEWRNWWDSWLQGKSRDAADCLADAYRGARDVSESNYSRQFIELVPLAAGPALEIWRASQGRSSSEDELLCLLESEDGGARLSSRLEGMPIPEVSDDQLRRRQDVRRSARKVATALEFERGVGREMLYRDIPRTVWALEEFEAIWDDLDRVTMAELSWDEFVRNARVHLQAYL